MFSNGDITMRYHVTFFLLVASLFLSGYAASAIAATTSEDLLTRANSYLEQGQYFLALQETDSALQHAVSKELQSQASGLKGNILLLMQHYNEAEKFLLQAFSLAEKAQIKADYANSLGVLYHEIRDKNKPQQYFKTALELAGNDAALALKIKLNWLRAQPQYANLSQLNKLLTEISILKSAEERVRFALNLATSAKSHGSHAFTVVQNALEKANIDSVLINNIQLRVEALDSLAELYESQGKDQQALELSVQASLLAGQLDIDDLMINIEWRKGRIYQRRGYDDNALAAFRKAVDHIQTIRRDIPITYENGRSSFREKLEPVYLGYAYHLLKKSGRQEGEDKQRTLLLARQTIEQIKQSELEDFLGGRCLIEGLQRKELENIDSQAAILYPIILPDRLELLVSIGKEISQFTVPVSENHIRDAALSLSNQLRQWTLAPDYQQSSQNLYQWMITPIERELTKRSIKTLVIVPDGVLRLVPFPALYDGNHFLIEKYAISISPGISLMGSDQENEPRNYHALLAGLSKPGPVVEKLPDSVISAILQPTPDHDDQQKFTGARDLLSQHLLKIKDENRHHIDFDVDKTLNHTRSIQKLKEDLSLPGVEIELNNLKDTLKSTTLLNEQFTISNFIQQISNKPYEIVHIASHGLFSSDANSSFLMAYDDVLKLDDLKVLLKRNKASPRGIQLLTLSACETAEGDDRAPLGFTGVALKAEAQSALGSLWPISDKAASLLMAHFYKNLTQYLGKAESLRRAQLDLLKSPEMSHPSFWSPFILVGNWL
jgi:CHAT domain-containing protein